MDNNKDKKQPRNDDKIFAEVKHHHEVGFDITQQRDVGKKAIGRISFKEADELFRSWIDEDSWPYDALLFDPRVFTFIFEKTSRLIANKPKGTVTPREGSDLMKARLNNELLSYQWDMANYGGSMISKWAQMDMNTRKYGAAFALCTWRHEVDGDARVVYDGPDMKVLNNRDCAPDPTATSIEDCNWFQVRQNVTLQDLEKINDANRESGGIYKNLDKLRESLETQANNKGGDGRNSFTSRDRVLAGITEDPYGQDNVYKTIEIVTEYRKDRWITVAWKRNVVLRDIPNPYKNNQIPITMLRYYAVDDDLYGLSEIEPVKGLQKAINALLCQYVDEVNQNLYTPIAIGPGVKQHTLEWGKGARWMMNNPNMDFRVVQTNSNAAQYFQATYSALVAAMMTALGESSLGVSNMQPFQGEKTATEVKELTVQRNARDQFNQIFLGEAIKRQYRLWHSMNQALLFADKNATPYLFRIVGRDTLKFLKEFGLDAMELPNESVQMMYETNSVDGDIDDLEEQANAYMIPKHGVEIGEGDDSKVVPKMSSDDDDRSARIYLEPDDIIGQYDFFVDVESMAVNSNEQRKKAQEAVVKMLTSNPNVSALLATEKYKPKFKDLFVTWMEDLGMQGADKYFEEVKDESLPGGSDEKPLGGRRGRPLGVDSAKAGSGLNPEALKGAMGQVSPDMPEAITKGAPLNE